MCGANGAMRIGIDRTAYSSAGEFGLAPAAAVIAFTSSSSFAIVVL